MYIKVRMSDMDMEVIEALSCCGDSLHSLASCFQCGHSHVLAEPCSCSLQLLIISMASAPDNLGSQIIFMNAHLLDTILILPFCIVSEMQSHYQ